MQLFTIRFLGVKNIYIQNEVYAVQQNPILIDFVAGKL